MMHKHVYEYLDKVLRDITRVDALFGGNFVILVCELGQIPTVIPNGSRAQICQASLKRAYFWPVMKKMELKINMRVQSLAGVYITSCWRFSFAQCMYHPEIMTMLLQVLQ